MSSDRYFPRLLCAALLLICTQLHADWREAVPESRLIGAGELRMFGFPIYKAQLWSPALVVDEVLRYEQPFALELTYSRSISADDLVAASVREIIRIQANPPTPQQLVDWRQHMQQAFVDVAEGDRITGVFLPGQGARFYLGTTLRYTVADEVFARSFFAIWLDLRTRTPELRARLVGAVWP